jgi:predicted Mrr-cat superfamily restriction endonuclease
LKVNIVNDRKYIFSASYDTLSFTEPIQFTPISINQSILSKPEIKKFISFKKREMHELVEAFEILHHDKLFADLKYQVSMSSSLRNSYWDELKKCLNADYKNYVFSTVKDYLMRI